MAKQPSGVVRRPTPTGPGRSLLCRHQRSALYMVRSRWLPEGVEQPGMPVGKSMIGVQRKMSKVTVRVQVVYTDFDLSQVGLDFRVHVRNLDSNRVTRLCPETVNKLKVVKQQTLP